MTRFRTVLLNVLSAAVLLQAPGAAAAVNATKQDVVIIHDNDIHGHLRSFCYVEVGRSPDEHCDVGGAARRATLVRAIKRETPAPVLLVDAGDIANHGPSATTYRGQDVVATMNAIGYDAATPGNNEFKLRDGVDADDWAGAQAALAAVVKASRFPWICANVTAADGSPLPGVHPFVVKKAGHIRIALLGLTTPLSATYPQTKGLTFVDPVASAKTWIPIARRQADVVIAVTHLGVEEDRRLARETRGLAAIVGGHTHTFLYQEVVETNADGQPVPIVQDGEFGADLGVMRLRFERSADGGWSLRSHADQLLPVDSKTTPDRRLDEIVERYSRVFDAKVGNISGVPATPRARRVFTVRTLAESWKQASQADVGFQLYYNAYDTFNSDVVTEYKLRSILPVHDHVWRGAIDGATLKSLLEHGVGQATIEADKVMPDKSYSIGTTTATARLLKLHGQDLGVDVMDSVKAWMATARGP